MKGRYSIVSCCIDALTGKRVPTVAQAKPDAGEKSICILTARPFDPIPMLCREIVFLQTCSYNYWGEGPEPIKRPVLLTLRIVGQ